VGRRRTCLALPRTDLYRVLLAGIEGVPVRWGQSPQAITIDGQKVAVAISGARTDYDLVLGADGVHSTVRQLVLGPGAVRLTGQYARRFVIPGMAGPQYVGASRIGFGVPDNSDR
jgi:FAD-dependent urate hydroxylase